MYSPLKNLKKMDRSLYDEVQNLGEGKAYKTTRPAVPELEKPPKFGKIKNMMASMYKTPKY